MVWITKLHRSEICRMFTRICLRSWMMYCLDDNMDELASQVDVIFTATPQGFLAGVLT